MVVKKLLLTLRKRSDIDGAICCHSHSVQRGGMGNGETITKPESSKLMKPRSER